MAYDFGSEGQRRVRRPAPRRADRTSAILWEWDSTAGNWSQRTPPGAATALPYDRSGHSMVYDTVRQKTIMFSGWQPGAGFIHPEWWDWDGSAQTWTKHPLVDGLVADAALQRFDGLGQRAATARSCSAASTTTGRLE